MTAGQPSTRGHGATHDSGAPSLAERLSVLEAERDIARLMSTYTRLVDDGPDADSLAVLFAEDAVYETFGHLGEERGADGPIIGRRAIHDTFVALPALLSFTAHYLCNPEITVAPDCKTAEGRWLALELANVERDPQRVPLVLVAQYHNDFVRHEGWRFKRIRFGDSRSFRYDESFAHTRYVSMFDLHEVKD